MATGSGSRTFGRTRYTATPEVDRSFDADQWVLQLTQPLFRMEAILLYGEARSTVEQAAAQYAAAEQDLILRLARSYFDVAVAERHVAAARAQITALNEQLQAARHSFDAGVASVTDVDDTQSRTALAEAQVVAALNDLESSRAALEAIIGSSPPAISALKETAVLPRPVPADVASWINHAISENPAVAAANAAIAIADYEIDRSRSQRLPTVDMVATYGDNYSSGNITQPTNFGTNVERPPGERSGFPWPILEGGAFRAHVAEARAKKSKAQAEYMAAQRQAAIRARQSYSAVLSGVSQVQALETAHCSRPQLRQGEQGGLWTRNSHQQ